MSIREIDFSKTLTDNQIYECIMNNYSALSKEWIAHQWNWINNIYSPFRDHYKYLIIISLIEKKQSITKYQLSKEQVESILELRLVLWNPDIGDISHFDIINIY